jgi:hypothetical protein
MKRNVRVLIFIGVIIVVIAGLLAAQIHGETSGNIIPKWPGIVIIFGAYFYLFPKKKS